MRREADNNRVKRAMEHIMAAVTNLRSIKPLNVTVNESHEIDNNCKELAKTWKPGDECCLGLYQPRYCHVAGPRGGTRFCCSMFNVCKDKIFVNEKIILK